jgi:predicted transcriptional regulator
MVDQIDPECVLDVLSDEYGREILETLCQSGSALTAPEIAKRCGFSRATVYRRLETLESASLVTTETRFDPDGHHQNCYRGDPARLSLSVCSDGLYGTVSTDSASAAEPREDA